MFQDVRAVVLSGGLPEDRLSAVGMLLEQDGCYTSQEGALWDFKREWPFSYSDSYFGGIAREVCGFANASGGLLIFGVHNETRRAGYNKVIPNLDRLQQALDQLLTTHVDLTLRRYDTDTPNAVDVLLVHPLPPSAMPTRFKRAIDKYKPGIILIRQGHEIVSAEPRHVSILYCRQSGGDSDAGLSGETGGLLPPSPARVQRFIGRVETIDRIFSWLKESDEPRTFLYGKGGSGKTTIAYQVAKAIRQHGANVTLQGGDKIDNVIFVSAKQKALNTENNQQENFVGLDFTSEHELYSAILSLGNWTNADLSQLTLEQIKIEIKNFFDMTSNLIVIDDIDTLTTRGTEAGFDFLYGILWRAKRRSKILYTLRNAPSHSLSNSIEVPGLAVDGEYAEFVSACCEQFRVKLPDPTFRDDTLAIVSERRPLVIESIIALRRGSGSYERAVQLFEQNSGDDVRGYVFQREWDALPADNHGRYILAVLSLYGEPLTFSDLAALTRYDESRVTQAIADVREMFLILNDVGAETTYSLGALTRSFLTKECSKLDHYAALKERVSKYKNDIYPENPVLTRLRHRVETLILRGHREKDPAFLRQAWHAVIDPNLPVKMTEDPRFLSLQGLAACRHWPPLLDDARRFFSNAMQMGSEPEVDHLRQWFIAERESGYGVEQCGKITAFVQSGKRYNETEKLEFLSRKAIALYIFGRENRYSDPVRTAELWLEALKAHLVCFRAEAKGDTVLSGRSDEFSCNTCYSLFDLTVRSQGKEDLFRVVQEIKATRSIYLDPIEEPLARVLGTIGQSKGSKADLQRIRGRMEASFRGVDDAARWLDANGAKRVAVAIDSAKAALQEAVDRRSRSNLAF